jgi:hypothetical protein
MTTVPAAHPNPRLAGWTRWQAAAVHAAISASIGALAFVLMLLVWFPGELFRIAGGSTLIVLMVGVDVVLGPLLTLVVFDPLKRLLRFDLALIATVQLAALLYGTWVMFEARPAYVVFAVDRFDVVSTLEVDAAARAGAQREEFRRINLGRPKLVAAVMPSDPQARNEVVMAAMNGIDLLLTPRYWVPYAEARDRVLARAHPLDDIRKVDPATNGPVLEAALARLGRPAASLRALGVKAKDGEAVMLIDAETGEPVEMVPAVW